MKEFAAKYTDAWCSQDAASDSAFVAVEGTLFGKVTSFNSYKRQRPDVISYTL